MSETVVDCPAAVTTTVDERKWADGPTRADFVFGASTQWCELERGHAGMHVAGLAGERNPVDQRETTYWLWWHPRDDERMLDMSTPCPASLGDAEVDDGTCGLPPGHEGGHHYEYGRHSTAHLARHQVAVRVLEPTPPRRRSSSTQPGSPVVFLNARGTSMDRWQPVLDRLRGRARLITYDRAGMGDSTPRPAGSRTATYSDLADELRDLLAVLEVDEPVVLVGHSIGSLVARMFLDRHPDQVAGVVHVDGTVPWIVAAEADDDWRDGDRDDSTLLDEAAGRAEIEHLPAPQPRPTVLLVKTAGYWPDPPIPEVDQHWRAAQDELATATGGIRVDAIDASHHLQTHAPDLVALATLAVLEAAQAGETRPVLTEARVHAAGGLLPGSGDDQRRS